MNPIILIPARNEAECLPIIIPGVQDIHPNMDILVIDDASTDTTPDLLPHLGIQWIRLPERLGVGGAIRCGIQNALMNGYDTVIRMDADGQHLPGSIKPLLDALSQEGVDAVIGSRYLHPNGYETEAPKKLAKWILAKAISQITQHHITDPTSGFCAFGPRALRLLSLEHPAGFSEPEILLRLHLHGLRVLEIPVLMGPRIAGKTSLTLLQGSWTMARSFMAMLLVPIQKWEANAEEHNLSQNDDVESDPKAKG